MEALWARMCAGTREDGSPIAANDPEWASLHKVALEARHAPEAWLQFYASFAEDDRFRNAFSSALEKIWTVGVRATISAYCKA